MEKKVESLIDLTQLNHKIINIRIDWKRKTLSLKNPDIYSDPETKRKNTLQRKRDLSESLYFIYDLNKHEHLFYETSLIRFAKNQLIKNWPWIDDAIDNSNNYTPVYKIQYLTDLFSLEKITSKDFYYWINHFQEKYGVDWRKHVSKRTKYKTGTKSEDFDQCVDDLKLSKSHLAKFLFFLSNIYKTNENIYGTYFKAYFGNWIVREWPKKDEAFTSTKYKRKEDIKEHYTPISFFRDLLDSEEMTEKDFYDALIYFYRVVYIHKTEDATLNSNDFKTTRNLDAYDKCGIVILEKEKWDYFYSKFDEIAFNFTINKNL